MATAEKKTQLMFAINIQRFRFPEPMKSLWAALRMDPEKHHTYMCQHRCEQLLLWSRLIRVAGNTEDTWAFPVLYWGFIGLLSRTKEL